MKLLIGGGIATLIVITAVVSAFAVLGGGGASSGGGARLGGSQGPYRGSEPPAGIELVDFDLRDYSGAVVRSSDLRRKVVLLTFLDSQCTESCPVIASQIGRALDDLSNAERRRIFALAISTDPKEDTATSVRGFLRRNRALSKLHYVGGGEPESKLRRIWKQFNILSSLESGEDALHSAPVRIYEGGLWVATLHAGVDLTPASLAHDLRVALRASNP